MFSSLHSSQCSATVLDQSSLLAKDIAALSEALLPLMSKHGLSMSFGAVNQGGLCLADATRNPTSAYKARGALASAFVAQEQGASSVWTASAGNHGAGLAHAAHVLGMKALIYVPESAPEVKVANIQRFGANVIRVGQSFDECLAAARAERGSAQDGARFVHPFDERLVVAGQGTIGFELIEHLKDLSAHRRFDRVRVFVPIGGGGLVSGIASVLKTRWPAELPRPEIIGVVDESSPAAVVGALFGRPVQAVPDTIADGTRVARVGETFVSLAPLIDRVMLIPHDTIVATMRDYHHLHSRMLEPSGVLALAGERFARRHFLLPNMSSGLSYTILSGANVDPGMFENAVRSPMRMNLHSHERCAFDVVVRERDGELLRFLRAVGQHNIAGLTYKQEPECGSGTLHVDFEVARSETLRLERVLSQHFPGSYRLAEGSQALFSVGDPVAQAYREELITLDDRPGSFLRYTEALHQQGALGSVGFLFYRKPAQTGSKAQVVIGRHVH